MKIKLGEIVSILDNVRTPVNKKERQVRVGKIPYYGATGVAGYIDDYLFNEELVLLGEDAAPFFDKNKNVAFLIRGKSWVNNHAHVLRGFKKLLSNKYVMYYLNQFNYTGFVSGTTRLKLNQGKMKEIPISIVPFATQQRIVSEIEKQFARIDAGIEALSIIEKKLKEYKASVLKSAVEGQLTEQWRKDNPDVQPASELLQDILKARKEKRENDKIEEFKSKGKWPQKNEKWKEQYKEPNIYNELKGLPEGWETSMIDVITNASETCCYGVVQPGIHDDDGICLIRVGDINFGKISNVIERKISNDLSRKYSRTILEGGEILISLVGAIGRTAVVPESMKGFNIARAVGRIRVLDPDLINPKRIEIMFRSPNKQQEMVGKSHEVARKTLNIESVRNTIFPLPSIKEQNIIVNIVESKLNSTQKLIDLIHLQLLKSSHLKQSILQKAFSGGLVKQLPEDGNVEELLKEIKQAKQEYEDAIKLKKKKK